MFLQGVIRRNIKNKNFFFCALSNFLHKIIVYSNPFLSQVIRENQVNIKKFEVTSFCFRGRI